MDIGVVENNLAGQTLLQRLRYARRLGFTAVELLCAPDNQGKENLRDYRETPIARIKLKFAGILRKFNQVTIHAYFNNLHDPIWNVPHPRCADIYLSEIEWSLRVGKALGATVVTFHPGWLAYGKTVQTQRSNLAGALKRLDKMAQAFDMRLGVEVVDWFMPLERFRLLRRLRLRNIGITLDVGHAVFCGRMGISKTTFNYPAYRVYGSLPGFIRVFGDLIVNAHIHDCNGKRDHLALGAGGIDFPALAAALRKARYQGPLHLETDVSTPALAADNLARLRQAFGFNPAEDEYV